MDANEWPWTNEKGEELSPSDIDRIIIAIYDLHDELMRRGNKAEQITDQ